MEHLNSVTDELKSIDESNIEYINILDFPEFVFGNVPNNTKSVDFCKFPNSVQEKMKQHGHLAEREMKNLNSSSCGNRLRFHTTSKRLIFKVQLKRKYGYDKMVNWGSMGFDVYNIKNNQYIHQTVFAPANGNNIFAEQIPVHKNGDFCIFLPNYNTVQDLLIGIEKDSIIEPIDYSGDNKLPIVFYGNSVTQGAAASRSGNAFPSVVSKMLNRDIINLSCSSCCRGDKEMAELIGKINCHAIVVDYTRNAYNITIFKKTHENFYKTLRKYHPDIKIILLTSESFNHWIAYDMYDEVVETTYLNAIERNENTHLIFQNKLFDDDEFNFIAIDSSHYTDYAMFKIAEEICKILNAD